MTTAWVLVANNAQGRLLRYVSGRGLEEFEILLNPEARMKEQDLVSDAPGRGLNRPRASRFSMSAAGDHKTHESHLFAQTLARRVEAARRQGSFQRLHIIAEPSFLGRFRAHLDAVTRSCVQSETAKNVARFDMEQIRALLPRRL